MAGYYDPNLDYSKAIEEAKSKGQDTTKLEQERQNKIDDKYGGKEPTMYGSDKTYSQLSGSNGSWQNQDVISNAINISNTTQNNAIKQQMEQAAQAGDWDKVGSLSNGLAVPDGRYGGQDLTYVNQAWNEVAQKYGYNAKNYYDQRYDEAYGAGSAAVWDATNGAVKTIDQWNQLTGGAAIPTQSGSASGIQTGGTISGSVVQNSDAYQYLRDMYEQNMAAQKAALQSAYEQNVADSEAYDDLISAAYQNQKNQAAAQNDLQRMQMNEYGIMRGLNTGASGQMALSQSAALQSSLAQLGTQEAQSLSDNALERQKLAIAYRNAVNEAEAEGNYQLASALYQEYVRQDELAWQKQQAAQEQANWEAQFAYQQQANDRDYANTMAMTMLANGIMPDSDILKAAGISDSAAQSYQQLTAQQIAAELAYQQALTRTKSSGGSGSTSPVLTYSQMMDAIESGSMTPNVLSAYKYYMGEDYGSGTGADNPGNTGESGYNSSYFNAAMSSMRATLDQGHMEGALSGLDSMWNKLSEQQKDQVQQLLARYGIAYEEG